MGWGSTPMMIGYGSNGFTFGYSPSNMLSPGTQQKLDAAYTKSVQAINNGINSFVNTAKIVDSYIPTYKGQFEGAPIWESAFWGKGSAVTLPPWGIFVGNDVYDHKNDYLYNQSLMTLRHEWGHWDQYQDVLRVSVVFYIVYGFPSITGAIKSKFNPEMSNFEYYSSPVEMDANVRSYVHQYIRKRGMITWDPDYVISNSTNFNK